MTKTQAEVTSTLRDGLDGGYVELLTWTPLTVAQDMVSYASDYECEDPVELTPLVEEAQRVLRTELS